MIQQKQVTIGGDTFTITHLPATKGIRVLKEVAKLAGPIMAAKESGDFGVIASTIIENLEQVNIEGLLKELINSVSKGSVAINFDMEFAGAYDKLFNLTKEVLEFNFGSVFTLLGSGE